MMVRPNINQDMLTSNVIGGDYQQQHQLLLGPYFKDPTILRQNLRRDEQEIGYARCKYSICLYSRKFISTKLCV